MSAFEWKPEMSVGIEAIDVQHRKLIGTMNQFYEAHSEGDTVRSVHALKALLHYTALHFADEERMMEKGKYAEFAMHQAIHRELLKKAGKLSEDYFSHPTPANGEGLNGFLRNWLTIHILGVDKKYSAPLKAQGLK